MTIRSWISLIVGPLRPEQYSRIYKYKPISTKLDQNTYDQQISDGFEFALELGKIAAFDFVYTLAPTNLQIFTNRHQTWSKSIWPEDLRWVQLWVKWDRAICPWIRKIAIFNLVYTLGSTNKPIGTKVSQNLYDYRVLPRTLWRIDICFEIGIRRKGPLISYKSKLKKKNYFIEKSLLYK